MTSVEKATHTRASLLLTVSLAFIGLFSQYYIDYSSVEAIQGKNVPGFGIPIGITGLFFLVSLLVICRKD